MRRTLSAILFAALLTTQSGCFHGRGCFLEKFVYPYSCPLCPYYDYDNRMWRGYAIVNPPPMQHGPPVDSYESVPADEYEVIEENQGPE
jgi:hypothetical protein